MQRMPELVSIIPRRCRSQKDSQNRCSQGQVVNRACAACSQAAEEEEAAEAAADVVIRLGLAAWCASAHIRTRLCPSLSSYTPRLSSASLARAPPLPCRLLVLLGLSGSHAQAAQDAPPLWHRSVKSPVAQGSSSPAKLSLPTCTDCTCGFMSTAGQDSSVEGSRLSM